MIMNLIDAPGAFGNLVGQLLGMMAFAALAVVGDAVLPAHPATLPHVMEPSDRGAKS